MGANTVWCCGFGLKIELFSWWGIPKNFDFSRTQSFETGYENLGLVIPNRKWKCLEIVWKNFQKHFFGADDTHETLHCC